MVFYDTKEYDRSYPFRQGIISSRCSGPWIMIEYRTMISRKLFTFNP